jgi:threonine dehydratase
VKTLRPETRVVVVEPETGAPVAAAIANGGVPVSVEYTPSFIDGAGSSALLPDMWQRAAPLVDDAFAIPLADAADAVRVVAERARVVAEGAAGLAVAAALAGHAGTGRVVCILCGGNIDPARLAAILDGRVPD